jgi:hypothetical protein
MSSIFYFLNPPHVSFCLKKLFHILDYIFLNHSIFNFLNLLRACYNAGVDLIN